MIEKKQQTSSNGSFLSVLMLLIILGILVTLGYYVFMEPEALGFQNIDSTQKKILVQGKDADLKSVAPEQANIRLYFANTSFDALNAEDRGVAKCPSILAYSKAVIAQLIKGPSQKGLYRTIPPAASLRAVFLYGQTLVVDFSKDLINQHPGGAGSELLTVYSIVNTLMELPPVDGKSIKNVQILINGYPLKTLIGHVNIERPLTSEAGLVSSI